MNRFIPLVALALLSGCAQIERATDWLASDRTQKAAANLRTLAAAFDCGLVASGASLSQQIARIVEAGDAAIGTTGKVYAVSAAICASLGENPSAAPVPVE